MRIVIDGTVGSGKTTILRGESNRDSLHRKFQCFQDDGFPVFGDLITNVIAEMRSMGIPDPRHDWKQFFERVTQLGIQYYNNAKPDTINFYDRGIYYLEIMANRYDQKMPDLYYDFVSSFKYDEPIFLFEPIPSLSMLNPHPEDNEQKVYTLSERYVQQGTVWSIYERYHYKNIISVPIYSDDIKESIQMRIGKMRSALGL